MLQYQSSSFLPDDYTQHFTIDQAAVQITRDDDSWSTTLGQAYVVTAAFRMTDASYDNNGVSGFHEFSQAQIDAAKLSMEGWSDVANITFNMVGTGDTGPAAYSDNAQILFGDYTTGADGAAAFTYLPRQGAWAGDVWVNSTQSDNQSPSLLNYGQLTLTHEIGHSIGMEHPGDYDASDSAEPNYYADAVYAEDTYQYSVMSYFSETNTGGNYNEYYPSAPQLDDITAAQRLYGANMTTRTGDTVYGFHSTADRPWFIATDASSPLIFSVWDAGGHDTFDFSGYAQASTIDLHAGAFSSVGGLVNNVSIAEGVTIEDAIGGSGTNSITGNDADNVLTGGNGSNILVGEGGDDRLVGGAGTDNLSGGDGNDTLIGGGGSNVMDGGAGDDYADFSQNNRNITIGEHQSLETIIGSAFDDYFFLTPSAIGDQAPDSIDAGAGNDTFYYAPCATTINGGAGDDVLFATDGNGQTLSLAGMTSVENLEGVQGDDILIGDAGANLITGNGGADTLVSGGGADTLEGGGRGTAGVLGDTASFATNMASVQVNLDAGTAVSGGAAVVLRHIMGIIGSAYADDITALNAHGMLSGGGGDDVFHLAATPGKTGPVDGGAGNDIVDFSHATAGLSISLVASAATLISIEEIIGSGFADTLTGNQQANTLAGGAGNDTLDGGTGDDRLDGGDGVDTVTYAGASHGVRVNLLQGTGGGAAAGADILVSIENLIGSSFDDIMTGGAGANSLAGGNGDDVLTWSGGADTLDGGAGTDTANFSSDKHAIQSTAADTVIADATDTLVSIERLVGTSFNDTLTAGVAHEALVGGDGRDTFLASTLGGSFSGGSQLDTLLGDGASLTVDLTTGSGVTGDAGALAFTVASIEIVTGGAAADTINGDDRADILSGAGGDDVLSGQGGRDHLNGGDGADILTGGLGADVLTGGAGADRFVFASVQESNGRGATDILTDLDNTDTIDLHLIDANTTVAGDQAFVEVAKFDHHAGELVLSYSAGTGVTKLMLDVDGDGKADMTVKLDGDHRDFSHFVL